VKKRSVVWNFFHKDPEDKTKTICQICFKVMLFSGSNGNMLCHLRTHKVLQEDDVEIPCSECGKLLKNKAALKRHEKIAHRDVDKFVCSYCPKAFASNSRRLVHERIHTGEKPYQVHCFVDKTCRFLKCESINSCFQYGEKIKIILFSVSRVWFQFPTKATAYQPHAGAHGGDAVLVPQVSAEVQAFSWQK